MRHEVLEGKIIKIPYEISKSMSKTKSWGHDKKWPATLQVVEVTAKV